MSRGLFEEANRWEFTSRFTTRESIETTLRPSVDVEYALMKDGKEVGKQTEDWRGLSDSGQRLTLARLIDTRQLNTGEYELTIRIRDRVSGQALAPSAKFTVLSF